MLLILLIMLNETNVHKIYFFSFNTEDAQMSFDEDKQRRYTTTSSITLYPGVDDNGAIYSCEARHPALERYLRCSVAINVLRKYI